MMLNLGCCVERDGKTYCPEVMGIIGDIVALTIGVTCGSVPDEKGV
jgi:hypothetical protein